MAKIDYGTIDKIGCTVTNLLMAHTDELDEAYLRCGDDPLKISISAKLSAYKGGLKLE